jgi:hypothetical protein
MFDCISQATERHLLSADSAVQSRDITFVSYVTDVYPTTIKWNSDMTDVDMLCSNDSAKFQWKFKPSAKCVLQWRNWLAHGTYKTVQKDDTQH